MTSETHEDQTAGEESPVVFESAQTEATPEEVSPVADETEETEPLEEVKIEAEETEHVEEADGVDVIKLEEESPFFPSPDAEPVEVRHDRRGRFQNLKCQKRSLKWRKLQK